MSDNLRAMQRVAFFCVQCQRPIGPVVCFGEQDDQKIHFRVTCHGHTEMVKVPWHSLEGIRPETPLVVKCLIHAVARPIGNPNVRFYCRECDAVTDSFTYQYVPNQEEHCFSIVCHGRICNGRTHSRIFKATALQSLHIFDHTAPMPVILPITGKLNPVRTAKIVGQRNAPSFAPPPKLRKLRLE